MLSKTRSQVDSFGWEMLSSHGEFSDVKVLSARTRLAQKDKLRLNEAWARLQLGSLRILENQTDEGLRFMRPGPPLLSAGRLRGWLSKALTYAPAPFATGRLQCSAQGAHELLKLVRTLGDPSQVALHTRNRSILSDQGILGSPRTSTKL